jgi:hypothetical protein
VTDTSAAMALDSAAVAKFYTKHGQSDGLRSDGGRGGAYPGEVPALDLGEHLGCDTVG